MLYVHTYIICVVYSECDKYAFRLCFFRCFQKYFCRQQSKNGKEQPVCIVFVLLLDEFSRQRWRQVFSLMRAKISAQCSALPLQSSELRLVFPFLFISFPFILTASSRFILFFISRLIEILFDFSKLSPCLACSLAHEYGLKPVLLPYNTKRRKVTDFCFTFIIAWLFLFPPVFVVPVS